MIVPENPANASDGAPVATESAPPIPPSASEPTGRFTDEPEAAREYIASGYAPIPYEPYSKAPTRFGWQHERYTAENVGSFTGSNIGLILGSPSGNLVETDLDCSEAVRAAEVLLPVTTMVSGRAGAPRSHWWYWTDSPVVHRSYADPCAASSERAMIAELRTGFGDAGGIAQQTMVPPSIHPSGETVVWDPFGPPAAVPADQLTRAVARVAAAALLARYWPAGNRHNAVLALAGGLHRAGWPTAEIEQFVRAVCAAARDTEVQNRIAAVRDTVRSGNRGKSTTGFRALAELIDSRVVARVREWLGVRDRTPPAARLAPAVIPIPAYRPFPVHRLPKPWGEFVNEGARALHCDAAYVALPVLAVLAGAIGMTRRIHLGGEWTEPAVLWPVLVGESGTMKTPAAELSQKLVAARQARLHAKYKTALAEFKAKYRAWKASGGGDDEPEAPVLERILVGNITYEKLVATLADNERGLLRYHDEFAGFIASLARYRASAASSDEADWLPLHRAGALMYDRKTGDRTTVVIPHAAVSVLGTIQPGKLKDLLRPLLASGFAARLLFAMPPRAPKRYVANGIPDAVKDAAVGSLDRLYELAPAAHEDGTVRPVDVRLSAAARSRWERFVNEWGERQYATDGDLAAAMAKLEGAPARFALIHNLTMGSPFAGDGSVSLTSLEAGIEIAEWMTHETIRVYRMLGESDGNARLRALADAVARLAAKPGAGGRVKPRDLARSRSCATAEAVSLLEELVAAGVGRWESGCGEPGRGGKVADVFVVVPPDDEDDDPEYDTPPDRDVCAAEPRDTGFDAPTDDSARDETVPHADPVARTDAAGSLGGNDPVACAGDADPVGHVGLVGHVGHVGHVGCTGGVEVVCDSGQLPAVADAVRAAGRVGIAVVTTGPGTRGGALRLLSVATPAGASVIDCAAVDPTSLFATLAAAELVGRDLLVVLSFLMPMGFVPGKLCDVMLAEQVLDAGLKRQEVPAPAVARPPDESGPLTDSQLRAAADAATEPLRRVAELEPALTAARLLDTAQLENRALPGVAEMAVRGAAIDRPAWQALADAAAAEAAAAVCAMNAMLAEPVANWNSTAQVNSAFAALGLTLPNTQDDTLAALGHPLADLLRRYRSAAKLVSSYGAKWLDHVAPDGRVYPRWTQNATATGRMSCAEPNMQQLPKDERYRRCVIAPPGRALVFADYAQIELRIVAALAGEVAMIDAFARGDDLHALTAAAILPKPLADVTKDDRRLAKAVNFGLIFGCGAERLVKQARSGYGVTMTLAQAETYHDEFFRAYPRIADWHRCQGRFAVGDTRTRGGRRRQGMSSFNERVNAPVQGGAADGLKAALALLAERRHEHPTAFVVLTAHDEIVMECDIADADAVKAHLTRAMMDGMAPQCLPVPVEVEAQVARNWAGDPL